MRRGIIISIFRFCIDATIPGASFLFRTNISLTCLPLKQTQSGYTNKRVFLLRSLSFFFIKALRNTVSGGVFRSNLRVMRYRLETWFTLLVADSILSLIFRAGVEQDLWSCPSSGCRITPTYFFLCPFTWCLWGQLWFSSLFAFSWMDQRMDG
ncbi:hypothetical protein DL95DRAFT_38551 [Leptodontidium sp. 2 PMI_412]|nr:hypothetical protein DL95DRAFT_38551 [Leptodontidium sp. 2 PMI_412]